MKISSKVECGIISLVDICIYSNYDTVTVIKISSRQNISVKYLEQIIQHLRHADIVRSVKGAKGGYVLTRPPEQITMRDVINALDSNILCDVAYEGKDDSVIADALSECLWDKMTASMQELAAKVTLRDVADMYDRINAESKEEPMYYI